MTSPQFVDISSWQTQNIDWSLYKQWAEQWDGTSTVAIRASYGVGKADPNFPYNRANALKSGITRIIYYHYGYPQYNTGFNEAGWFHQVVGAIRPEDRMVLDLEEQVSEATGQWAYNFLSSLQGWYSDNLAVLYSSESYIQQRLQYAPLGKFKLWLADWTFHPDSRPVAPSPFSSYECLQYTDNATNVPGISGTLDGDVYLGTVTRMLQLSDPMGKFFTDAGNNRWHCPSKNVDLIGSNLQFYREHNGIFGLPLTNEIYLPEYPGTALVLCERGILCYDPKKSIDNPPGSGNCYLLHLDNGLGQSMIAKPLVDALNAKIAELESGQEVTQLKSVLAQIQKLATI